MSDEESKIVVKVGMNIHPVKDLEPADTFYADGLGLEPLFRDGDRIRGGYAPRDRSRPANGTLLL